MTLTYIFHSGFVLETEQSILVFDYWLDPSGVMDGVLRSEKPMYVFSSHFHEDHFTKDIFEWKKQREGVTYMSGRSSVRVSPTFSPRTSTNIGEPARRMLTYGWPREAHGLMIPYPYGH